MQPSQVVVLVSILFGLGGLLFGFLLGVAWASRRAPASAFEDEPEEEPVEQPEEPTAAPAPVETPAAAAIEPTAPVSVQAADPAQPVGFDETAAPELSVAEIPTIPMPVPAPDAETPTAPTPAAPPRSSGSIIEQINSVLLEMTSGTPLASRNIHLSSDAKMGVVVWVGSQRYNGVDSVPDEEIRNTIKAAVKKWEDG